MDMYCAYLRKSRADREAEARGEGETLARHKGILMDLSRRLGMPISRWYAEVVSGDTIASRPVMQELLADIERGMWSGVYVVEIERLARGDTIDQGIVSRTFQFTDTRIITPSKTYDPNNEFDSEYFEFSLFMSRREYKAIKRRMQAGRLASVKEGNYIGSTDPYGYRKVRLAKGFTLEVVPEEARVTEQIFRWFCLERLGRSMIATRLNTLGVPTKRGATWTFSSVDAILSNPLYIGKVRWGYRQLTQHMQSGTVTSKRPINPDALLADGKHPAIIDDELYQQAQHLRESHSRPGFHARLQTISNPFAGLIECGICHHHIQFRRRGRRSPRDTVLCVYHCGCIGSYFDDLEAAVLDGLRKILASYEVAEEEQQEEEPTFYQNALQTLAEEKQTEEEKLDHIFDLLEKGVYSVEDFTRRREIARTRIATLDARMTNIKKTIRDSGKRREALTLVLPKMRSFLTDYNRMTPGEKNTLLREIIDHMTYTKTVKRKRGGEPAPFTLDIFPKIPLD